MPTRSAAPSTAPRSRRSPLWITIDGPAGVGKSTVAKLLARRLGLLYVDTGATYRALAYQALLLGADPRDERAMARLARALGVALRRSADDGLRVLLNRRDVTRQIRTERVTEAASAVAQHPAVRRALVRLQRRLARGRACVVEGRDTGSVVFPKARYKFFLTADVRIRARRRQMELRQVQGHAPKADVLARQLKGRDNLDRRRAIGPLIRPPHAMVLDTSRLKAEQVVQQMLRRLPIRTVGKDSSCIWAGHPLS